MDFLVRRGLESAISPFREMAPHLPPLIDTTDASWYALLADWEEAALPKTDEAQVQRQKLEWERGRAQPSKNRSEGPVPKDVWLERRIRLFQKQHN